MMADKHEGCRLQCLQEHEQWKEHYRGWMDDYACWKGCEQKVVGLIYELQSALPDHRLRLDDFSELITGFVQLLEEHQQRFEVVRPSMIDADCPSDLSAYKQIGVSRCTGCEPQCIEGLLESHRQASETYQVMVEKREQLRMEFEAALPRLQQLADRLQRCLNK